MDTVQEIQEQIALQNTHNESRLEDIRAKIERAENLGVGTHKLQYELDAAIKTIQAGASSTVGNRSETKKSGFADLGKERRKGSRLRSGVGVYSLGPSQSRNAKSH